MGPVTGRPLELIPAWSRSPVIDFDVPAVDIDGRQVTMTERFVGGLFATLLAATDDTFPEGPTHRQLWQLFRDVLSSTKAAKWRSRSSCGT